MMSLNSACVDTLINPDLHLSGKTADIYELFHNYR